MTTTRWRCSDRTLRLARIGLVCEACLTAALLVLSLFDGAYFEWGMFSAVALSFWALATWRLTFVPFLEARQEGMFVRNPFSQLLIQWDDIKKITPGYYGLQIERSKGYPVSVWCVQENRIDTALGKRTRSTEVIDALAAFRSGEPSFVPTETVMKRVRERERYIIAVGIGLLALSVFVQVMRG